MNGTTYQHAKMVGIGVVNPHKKTSRSGKIDDVYRRRAKRVEKEIMRSQVKSGVLASFVTLA